MSEEADMKFHIQTPFEKQIVGALRCCIDAHGPVTREFVGSAAKRIAAQLEALQEAQSLPEVREAELAKLRDWHDKLARGCEWEVLMEIDSILSAHAAPEPKP